MSCDFTALSNLDPTDPDATQRLLEQCTATLTDPTLWIWAIVFTVACAAVGALIGKYKNAIARDTLLGLALGPIGWAISLLLPARKPPAKCGAWANLWMRATNIAGIAGPLFAPLPLAGEGGGEGGRC